MAGDESKAREREKTARPDPEPEATFKFRSWRIASTFKLQQSPDGSSAGEAQASGAWPS